MEDGTKRRDRVGSGGLETPAGKRAFAPDGSQRAQGFQAVRDARRSELAEDYVELIAELIEATGEARPVDIATRMGVTQPTVAKAIERLKREGLVQRERYRSVFLTDAGRALADGCRRRHEVVVRFLIRLGLDPETAELDAEGIEHHVSPRTLDLFEAFASSPVTE